MGGLLGTFVGLGVLLISSGQYWMPWEGRELRELGAVEIATNQVFRGGVEFYLDDKGWEDLERGEPAEGLFFFVKDFLEDDERLADAIIQRFPAFEYSPAGRFRIHIEGHNRFALTLTMRNDGELPIDRYLDPKAKPAVWGDGQAVDGDVSGVSVSFRMDGEEAEWRLSGAITGVQDIPLSTRQSVRDQESIDRFVSSQVLIPGAHIYQAISRSHFAPDGQCLSAEVGTTSSRILWKDGRSTGFRIFASRDDAGFSERAGVIFSGSPSGGAPLLSREILRPDFAQQVKPFLAPEQKQSYSGPEDGVGGIRLLLDFAKILGGS